LLSTAFHFCCQPLLTFAVNRFSLLQLTQLWFGCRLIAGFACWLFLMVVLYRQVDVLCILVVWWLIVYGRCIATFFFVIHITPYAVDTLALR
jgi:hypothetical protein